MTVFSSHWPKIQSFFSDARMWLFFITINLALWQGILTSRINSSALTTTIFFWLVALFILWKKRKVIYLDPKPWKNLIGIFLLAIVIYRGLLIFWYENFILQFIPFLGILSLALIASGWQGVKQYIRPLLAFLVFSLVDGISYKVFTSLPDSVSFPKLTTSFSAFLLHYIGFDIALENVSIVLPSGSVKVLYSCTGGPLVSLLLQLTLLLFLVAPLNWRSCLKILLGLFGLGFFLGVVRVALLAAVVSDQSAFDFWHGSEGNQIFSLIAFTSWIVIAHFVYEYYENQLKHQEPKQQKDNGSDMVNSPREGQSMTPLEYESSRLRFLSGLGIIVTSVTLCTLFFPQIGRRQMLPLQFPSQLSLNGWNRENSVSISEHKSSANNSVQEFRSGQRYQYRQKEISVTVELKHLNGIFGNVGKLMNTYSNLGKAYQKGKADSIEGVGRYQLFTNKTHAYLTTCIPSQGESTITMNGFVSQMNQHLLRVDSRLLLGLIGKRSLRERHCLWVNLSTPLQGESPETKYLILESVFQEGYPKWQGLFYSVQ